MTDIDEIIISPPKKRRRRRGRKGHSKEEMSMAPVSSSETTGIQPVPNPEMFMESINPEVTAVQPMPAPPQIIDVVNGGAGRGAEENIRAFENYDRHSTQSRLRVTYAEPVPGRGAALLDDARLQRLLARVYEGKVEDLVLAQGAEAVGPILLNMDRASGDAKVLRSTANSNRPILGYLLIKLPSGRLWGLRFVLEPHDIFARAAMIDLFELLAAVSERNTSDQILGDEGDPAHIMLEPLIRDWFAEHTQQNLKKIVAGIEPVTASMEITDDGRTTYPLFVVPREEWGDPVALAEQIVANPTIPIRRGTQFVIAELSNANAGIRFHVVRRRTDDKITVGGAEVYDAASVDARQEQLQRQARAALERAQRETISRSNPIWTTD